MFMSLIFFSTGASSGSRYTGAHRPFFLGLFSLGMGRFGWASNHLLMQRTFNQQQRGDLLHEIFHFCLANLLSLVLCSHGGVRFRSAPTFRFPTTVPSHVWSHLRFRHRLLVPQAGGIRRAPTGPKETERNAVVTFGRAPTVPCRNGRGAPSVILG